MPLSIIIADLRERIAADSRAVPRIGVELAGIPLYLGGVHEWFGEPNPAQPSRWLAPMCILADLARRALAEGAIAHVFWIGARMRPYPLLLDQHRSVLRHSVLIDPPDVASRLWAIDVALRTPSPVAVIADAEGLTLPHTRRLQLAAGSGGALCLLARPPGELDRLSAATTRWRITHAPSPTQCPRWTLALIRNKERPALMDEPPSWTVEWNHAQGLVCLPAALSDRPHLPAARAG